MQRLLDGSVGVIAFTFAHLVEVLTWQRWFAPAGDVAPWFLNSGRAVVFTASFLFVIAFAMTLVTGPSPRQAVREGGDIACGAAIALTLTLFLIGSGTIAPLVLVIGWIIAGLSAVGGALVAALLRR